MFIDLGGLNRNDLDFYADIKQNDNQRLHQDYINDTFKVYPIFTAVAKGG